MSKLTFPHWCSDFFAKIFASWRFVIPFLIILNIWVLLNLMGFIALDERLEKVNLFISQVTLFIDLVIIMNQRRQTNTDRDKLAAILALDKKIEKNLLGYGASLDELHRKTDKIIESNK